MLLLVTLQCVYVLARLSLNRVGVVSHSVCLSINHDFIINIIINK